WRSEHGGRSAAGAERQTLCALDGPAEVRLDVANQPGAVGVVAENGAARLELERVHGAGRARAIAQLVGHPERLDLERQRDVEALAAAGAELIDRLGKIGRAHV